ncbi:FitA-like ribbon-helix-helix domain-containing protein [Gordonia malaquae]|uniref:FitA-like ribbon-helix-helix domain-containing protein n=1 Tax=Gordonia malaquae TaxID=410332 RepID=UPI003016AFC2
MTTITIRNVPDEVRNELAARAARAGQSLQEFMLKEVEKLAERPSMEDLLSKVRERKRAQPATTSTERILADLDADRR